MPLRFCRVALPWFITAFGTIASIVAQAATSETKPWVRYVPKNREVIVFVHGVLGDARTTWASGDQYWPSMLTHDSTFDGQNIYVYHYPSPRSGQAFSVDEIAENMRLVLMTDGVLRHHRLTFVSHSMGGLVTRAFILKYQRAIAPKIRFLYFFATPTTGTPYAVLASIISRNPQFGQIYPMQSDNYLGPLQSSWLAADLGLKSYCAYETQPLYGRIIVERQSATNLCTQRLDPIDADHIAIVKPASETSTSYRALKAAFMETEQVAVPAKIIGPKHNSRSSNTRAANAEVEATSNPEAYMSYLSANELFNRRRVDDRAELQNAIRRYDDAISLDPNFGAAIARRAYAYLWMSRILKSDKGSWRDLAHFEVERAERINPKLFEVHLMKGSILTDEAEYKRARLELERALEINPRSEEAYKKLSTLHLQMGEYQKALDAAHMAVEMGSRFFDNYVSVGYAAMQLCHFSEAEAAYLKVTELAPERPEGWNGLGTVRLYQGEFIPSIDFYTKALSKGPPAVKPLANMAVAYFYLGQYEKGLPSAIKALDLAPENYTFTGNVADYYRAMHQSRPAGEYYNLAISLAHQALRHNENDWDALISLALFYARTGRPKQANEELVSAISHVGDHPPSDFAYSAAIVFTLLNRPEEAISRLQYALSDCKQSVKMAQNEPDLAALNKTPFFQQIINEHVQE